MPQSTRTEMFACWVPVPLTADYPMLLVVPFADVIYVVAGLFPL